MQWAGLHVSAAFTGHIHLLYGAVPWAGLLVSLAFLGHIHLLYDANDYLNILWINVILSMMSSHLDHKIG